MTEQVPGGLLDTLRLRAFESLLESVAHDLRNTLNGVTVNLEVVRSRASREGSTGAQVAPFAQSAVAQLEAAVATVEALLALGRPPREPVDVGRTLSHAFTLLRQRDGKPGTLPELPRAGEWLAAGDARLVRLLLIRVALDAAAADRFAVAAERRGEQIDVSFTGVAPSDDTRAAIAVAAGQGMVIRAPDEGTIVLTLAAAPVVGA